jgi:septal ring factor EnvC (AmiA/AmiB activator)
MPPNEMAKAVKKVYQRPLRDFAFLFAELDRQKAVLLSDRDALVEDNAKWEATLASAEKLGKFREDEINLLESDLAGMKQDRAAIEAHLTIVKGQIEEALRRIEGLLAQNASLAQQLADQEAALRQMINATAPAPAVSMP